MATKFLFSNVWPLKVKEGKEIISDRFLKELEKADELRISVGYCGHKSLKELDRLVQLFQIKKVSLTLGMYSRRDFPKRKYKLALEINENWQQAGIGEIRITEDWRYHGKLYCFLKNNQIFSVISGSANLSFLFEDPKEAEEYPQYETGFFITDPEALKDSLEHINDLLSPGVSENIDDPKDSEILSSKEFLKWISTEDY